MAMKKIKCGHVLFYPGALCYHMLLYVLTKVMDFEQMRHIWFEFDAARINM